MTTVGAARAFTCKCEKKAGVEGGRRQEKVKIVFKR